MRNSIQTGMLRLVSAHPAARHGAKLFVRNAAASIVAFAFDLALLWLIKEVGINDLVTVSVAFLLAMTLHYVLARTWVFRGTDRGGRSRRWWPELWCSSSMPSSISDSYRVG